MIMRHFIFALFGATVRILLTGLGLFALAAAQPALSADRPLPYKAPPLEPIFNWTGFYVGLNAGYSWGDTRLDYDLGPLTTTLHPSSFIGGGQAGFNWQMGNVVWGLEADIAWRNGKDDLTFAFPNGLDFTSFHVEQNWVGTVRPRLGFANNNWLFYVTGGLAYGGLQHSYMEFRPTVAGATRTATEDVTRAGWTVGGGVEVAFNRQLSLGLEYLYMDFGSSTLTFPAQVVGGLAFPVDSTRFRDTSQVVRAKLNWRM
jgi:outer membrane immunogenic protein